MAKKKQPQAPQQALKPKEPPDPRTPSSDYRAMVKYWAMVSAILDGVEALRSTSIHGGPGGAVAGPARPYASLSQLNTPRRGRNAITSPYLPQFPNEQNADYDLRRQTAPLTNIYADISANLASKPFSKTLQLASDTSDDLQKLAENIDGQGNNLHVFAAEVFKAGLDKGIDWILVDYDNVPRNLTLAEEKEFGVRPYWVRIPCERLLAVYSDFVKGQEVITHARIYECKVQPLPDEFDEELVESVRIFDRAPIYELTTDAEGNVVEGENVIGYEAATWEVLELQTATVGGKTTQQWVSVSSGDVTIGIIPLVPYRTGKRDGTSWRIEPPLRNIAHLQIEEFQQESNLKTIKELTAFPMAAGQGVEPQTDSQGQQVIVPIGPRAVLFAPPSIEGKTSGRWEWMEPSATSLTFLANDLEKLRDEMRDLGMQPLASANLTVITTANVSMKAHNAVQAWALGLKDCLEQAWELTCLWLKQSDQEVSVQVHTDFGVDFEAGTELTALQAARINKDISQETLWDEFKRRGTLSDDFDPEEEKVRLADEAKGLQPEMPIDPMTGLPLKPLQPPPMQQPPQQQQPNRRNGAQSPPIQ